MTISKGTKNPSARRINIRKIVNSLEKNAKPMTAMQLAEATNLVVKQVCDCMFDSNLKPLINKKRDGSRKMLYSLSPNGHCLKFEDNTEDKSLDLLLGFYKNMITRCEAWEC